MPSHSSARSSASCSRLTGRVPSAQERIAWAVPPMTKAGAVWARVLHFIDRQLLRSSIAHRDTYRQGLKALDQSALALNQTHFSRLPPAEQEALVERLESGDLPSSLWGDLPPSDFFRLVRTHSMQGYYGDPRHGGNRDCISWRMLGVPYPPVRGRDDYRFPKRAATDTAPHCRAGVRS